MMNKPFYVNEKLVSLALREDIGHGDVTTLAVMNIPRKGKGIIRAKSSLILAGSELVEYIYHKIDPAIHVSFIRADGESLRSGDVIAVAEGNCGSILTGERTVLNFLQRMCGIATLTSEYTALVSPGSKTVITDTRKTIPGWRTLDKYAVRVGGGANHRFGLYDGILIKDNHIEAAGSVKNAIALARSYAHHLLKIEVEVTTMAQVAEAVEARADIIMLDNMSTAQVAEALEIIGGAALTEVSGGITADRIKELSLIGVDIISVGALTHSAVAKDINLTLERTEG